MTEKRAPVLRSVVVQATTVETTSIKRLNENSFIVRDRNDRSIKTDVPSTATLKVAVPDQVRKRNDPLKPLSGNLVAVALKKLENVEEICAFRKHLVSQMITQVSAETQILLKKE